jgi:hypothetical protein
MLSFFFIVVLNCLSNDYGKVYNKKAAIKIKIRIIEIDILRVNFLK